MKLNFTKIILLLALSTIIASRADATNHFPNIYNVSWDSQSKDSSESMPVGGGDIGVNVWVEGNELMLYMQRSGIHDEYNGFPKLGRLRVWCEPNIFEGATSFRQELILDQSAIEVEATHPQYGEVLFKVWVDVNRPKLHVECLSESEVTMFAQYESWRDKERELPINAEYDFLRKGWWDIGGYNGDVFLEADKFKKERSKFTFYHKNSYEKLTSRLSYERMGISEYYGNFYDPLKGLVWGGVMYGENLTFDGNAEGRYQGTDYVGWRYKSSVASRAQEVNMWFHNSRCDSEKRWLSELSKKIKEDDKPTQESWAENVEWWRAFWDRSHIIINADKDESDQGWVIGRNYNLFRYMTALNAYGENPTMFNGGLLTFDPGLVTSKFPYFPDWRNWNGGMYTLQNQRWVYWPMLKWGDYEIMEPQFDFFLRTLEVGKFRLSHFFGVEGWIFDESGTTYGLPVPGIYGFEESYMPHRVRPDWLEKGVSRNWSIMHHRTAQLEFSYMILEYYRYSGRDISRWLPIVKGTLDFFHNYYAMRHRVYNKFTDYDRDGKLILFPSSACESHFMVSNPLPDVAGLWAVVEAAMALPTEWQDEFFGGGDALKELHTHIPDMHCETIGEDTVYPPAKSIAYSNWPKTELYINYPMFPFDRIKLGDKEMEYVFNTRKHWETWQTPKAWTYTNSWGNANVAFARMGLLDEAKATAIKKLNNGPFRFPSFWGPGADWTPDHNWGGSGCVGLQEMLMQSIGDDILMLPAWPAEWNCEFKVLAPQDTIVEGIVVEGKLIDHSTLPAQRARDVRVYNPEQ